MGEGWRRRRERREEEVEEDNELNFYTARSSGLLVLKE